MNLTGKRIVNTRALHQAKALDDVLREYGATPISYPCIEIVPPDDTQELDNALQSDFDLLVLTSANTVTILAQRAHALGIALNGVQAAAVGSVTAAAARDQLGVEVFMIPDDYSAEGMIDALRVPAGTRILLPQSEIARNTLQESLAARGARVTTISAYRTTCGRGGVEIAPLVRERKIDAITFTSASTTRCFVERIDQEGGARLDGVIVACIGEQTAESATACGLAVDVIARTHTLEGLVEALVEGLASHFQEQRT